MQCNVWEVGSDDGNGTVDQGSIGVVPDGIESKEANSCRAKQYTAERRGVLGNTSPEDQEIFQGRGFCIPRPKRLPVAILSGNLPHVFCPTKVFSFQL